MPPSGPTTSTTSPSAGSGTLGERLGGVLVQHQAAAAPRTRPAAPRWSPWARPPGAGRAGTACRPRGHGIPAAPGPLAARAPPLHDAALGRPGHDLVDAALGGQLDRQLAAVALGDRLDQHQPRAGLRLDDPGRPPQLDGSWPSATTARLDPRPAPSARSRRSPTPGRRTVAACRPSGPSRTTIAGRPPGPRRQHGGAAVGACVTGLARRAACRRSSRSTSPTPALGRSSPRSRASSRSSSSCLASRRVGIWTIDVDEEVAAPGAAQVRDARAAQRHACRRAGCRAGCRARSCRRGSPAGGSRRARPPSSAARRWQCRSSPRRWKTGWRFTATSTYRSPAGPPPGPTSPSPASWMRMPVSTPAGPSPSGSGGCGPGRRRSTRSRGG